MISLRAGKTWAILAIIASAALLSASAASGDPSRPLEYVVTGTDGTLKIQQFPRVGDVVGQIDGNGSQLEVVCQTEGGPDPFDDLSGTTWYELANGAGWVYAAFAKPSDPSIPAPPQCPLDAGTSPADAQLTVSSGSRYSIIDAGSVQIESGPSFDGTPIRTLSGGTTATLQVICQITDGGSDPQDGLDSTTWDWIVDPIGGGHGWVYDHFLDTPAQGSDGASPGVAQCDGSNGEPPATGVPATGQEPLPTDGGLNPTNNEPSPSSALVRPAAINWATCCSRSLSIPERRCLPPIDMPSSRARAQEVPASRDFSLLRVDFELSIAIASPSRTRCHSSSRGVRRPWGIMSDHDHRRSLMSSNRPVVSAGGGES